MIAQGVGTGYSFAAISTDTGHQSTAFDASWAYNSPDRQNQLGLPRLARIHCPCQTSGQKILQQSPRLQLLQRLLKRRLPEWPISQSVSHQLRIYLN
jgi:hypothetical protein